MTLPRKNENRQALILWLILAFVVQILAFSRADVLALGVSLSLFFIAWLKITGHGWTDLRSIWSRLRPLYRAVIIAGIVIILGLGLLWLFKSFSGRSGSTQFRITLWRAALTIIADNPLTGAGPGNFGRAMLGLNDASFPRRQFSTAHNIYLNTAAELGLMGLFVGGYLMLKLVLAGWRRWRQLTRPADRIRLAACGAALAGLAVQTLVDTYMATPNMLIMLALVAYVVGDVRESSQTMRRPYPAYAALGILLAYAAGFSWLTVADLHFQRSFNRENRGDLTKAIGEVVRARELDPHLALRTSRLALLEARLAAQTGDEGWLQAATEHYQAGLQQEPIWGLNSANLAGLLWQQNKRVSAINMMQRSVAADDNPLYLINLGYFHEQDGDWARASAAYGRALSISPRLAASGFWQATPLRIERWPDIVEAAAEYRLTKVEGTNLSQRLLLTDIARARDDFDTVATLVSPDLVASDARFQPALAELYLEQRRPDLAATVLDPPDKSPQEYVLWGRIKMGQADDLAAEKMFKTAIFLGDQSANYYLGQLYEQQGDLQAAERAYRRGFSPHLISENVPVIIYGRFGANDLVPQLLRIGSGSGQTKSWLALARLYEKQQRFAEAKSVYELLLAEDPYLMIAQERLDLVAEKLTP